MNLKKSMKQFELSLYGELAPTTRRWYVWFDKEDNPHGMLASLVEDLGDREIESITTQDLREWRFRVFERKILYGNQRPAIEKELSPASKHGYIRALHRFFNWLMAEKRLCENPAALIRAPKLPDPDPKAVENETVDTLLNAADHPRDKAIILFLADTGCRVGGLCGVQLSDLNLQTGRTQVWEKGNGGSGKCRWVFLKPKLRAAIREYLLVRPESDSKKLFLSLRGGKPLQEGGVNQMLERVADAAALQEGVNPHAFRHAAARNWLLNGGDLATVSQLLGHSSVHVTTRYYARWTQDELQEWHNRISPY